MTRRTKIVGSTADLKEQQQDHRARMRELRDIARTMGSRFGFFEDGKVELNGTYLAFVDPETLLDLLRPLAEEEIVGTIAGPTVIRTVVRAYEMGLVRTDPMDEE